MLGVGTLPGGGGVFAARLDGASNVLNSSNSVTGKCFIYVYCARAGRSRILEIQRSDTRVKEKYSEGKAMANVFLRY